MAKYWGSLLVFCLVAQVVPFALSACLPSCRELGLWDVALNYQLPNTAGVAKYCWLKYSGSSYSQMSGTSVQMTTWTESLVEVTVQSNGDLLTQINPFRGVATSSGNPGLTGQIPGISDMQWPQNGAVVPLGFVYSGDSTTLETQIDMTGTNYAIDDAALGMQWCSPTGASFAAMGQSWGGHGLVRKYRIAGSCVFASSGCSGATQANPIPIYSYRIPINRVIGGDGSGTVRATSEVQFGTSVDQNWWYLTQHKLLFIKQSWAASSGTLSFRIDPSIKGPPDAAPASSTLWTGAITLAMTGGFGLVYPSNWLCANAPSGTMWSLLCTSGFYPTYWDNVDSNGVAIRVATFQIPVGSCVDTNYGQQAPAIINLSGSGFKFKSSLTNYGFVATFNDPSSTPISVTNGGVTASLLATAWGGSGGNWAWTGPTADLNKIRQGSADTPIYLELA